VHRRLIPALIPTSRVPSIIARDCSVPSKAAQGGRILNLLPAMSVLGSLNWGICTLAGLARRPAVFAKRLLDDS